MYYVQVLHANNVTWVTVHATNNLVESCHVAENRGEKWVRIQDENLQTLWVK